MAGRTTMKNQRGRIYNTNDSNIISTLPRSGRPKWNPRSPIQSSDLSSLLLLIIHPQQPDSFRFERSDTSSPTKASAERSAHSARAFKFPIRRVRVNREIAGQIGNKGGERTGIFPRPKGYTEHGRAVCFVLRFISGSGGEQKLLFNKSHARRLIVA